MLDIIGGFGPPPPSINNLMVHLLARTKIAKTNMAPIKRQFICSIPVSYVFFHSYNKHAVVGFSRLLE